MATKKRELTASQKFQKDLNRALRRYYCQCLAGRRLRLKDLK